MAKATFDHIYEAADPRPYFLTLGSLDYQIPAHGAAVFELLAQHLDERRNGTVRIADLCCSYGINAALLKHDASFEEIAGHYTATENIDLDRGELLTRDEDFFTPRRNDLDLEVVGIDTSDAAIEYGLEAGLLDVGVVEDLEHHDVSPELADALTEVDLVTVTGGIGYIGERTIGQVIDGAERQPWLAAMCLRWVDFEPVAEAVIDRGMELHHLDGVSFPQRQFADDDERAFALKELDRLGLEPDPLEVEGYHCAELYVAHPVDERPPAPLPDMLAPAIAAPDVIGIGTDRRTA